MMGNEAAISKRSFSLSDGSVPEGNRKLLAWTNEYYRNEYLGLGRIVVGDLAVKQAKKCCVLLLSEIILRS